MPRLSPVALLALVLLTLTHTSSHVLGHAHDGKDDDDEDEGGSGKMSGMMMGTNDSRTPEEIRREERLKETMLVAFHAMIASVVAWITMPLAVAYVTGRRADDHKVLMGGNTLALMFAGLVAAITFAEGDSWHAIFGIVTVLVWLLQAAYGTIRHFFFRATWPINPHRTAGIFIYCLTMATWLSGVLHVQGSCNDPSDVQMCNAHIVLGAFFVLAGLVHVYYHALERVASFEIVLILLGSASELVFEGVVDAVLNSIDPHKFPWDSHAKFQHLTAASMWFASGLIGLFVAKFKSSELHSRGIGMILGLSAHLFFMFIHSNPKTRTREAHIAHEIVLLVGLFARLARRQRLFAMCMIMGGWFFASAADPVTRDVPEIAPGAYVALVAFLSLVFFLVHLVLIQHSVLSRPRQTPYPDSIWVRSGIYGAFVFCCCCARVCCPPHIFSQPHGSSPLPFDENADDEEERNAAIEQLETEKGESTTTTYGLDRVERAAGNGSTTRSGRRRSRDETTTGLVSNKSAGHRGPDDDFDDDDEDVSSAPKV